MNWKFLLIQVTLVTLAHKVIGDAQSPPHLVREPNYEICFQVIEHEYKSERPFVIECEAAGEPTPNYRWTKNGKLFEWQAIDRISQQPGRGSLVVKSPRDEDEGVYQCFAENQWGIASSNSVHVRKAVLDSFNTSLSSVKVAREGDPFGLSCKPPSGYPKPRVYWLIQKSDGQFKNINDSRITFDPEGNLWFAYVTKEDESNESIYACAAVSSCRNEVKLGNKILLKVLNGSSTQQNIAPVQQYVTRSVETALKHRRVGLYCIFGGTPQPVVVWFKNGKRMIFSGRISQENFGKSIWISRIEESDEGNYTCEVNNGVGDPKSHTVNLKVLSEPEFIEEPHIVTAGEDETVVITCKASGNPEPQINWIHNGKPISEASPNPRRKIFANSIRIEGIKKSDIANYGCNASNSLGYVYADVYVNVLVAVEPNIVEPPLDDEVVEAGTIVLKCRVTGHPKPVIRWIKDGVELTGGRYSILENGDLQIKNVGFMDMGNYTCFAQNKISSINSTASLVVRKRTIIAYGQGPKNQEIKVGDSVTFACYVLKDIDLDYNLEWLRDGEIIDYESQPRFAKLSDQSLLIAKAVDADSGVYTCLVTTRIDSASSNATLIVQDKPNRPQLDSISCNNKSADISWTPHGDNRAPILNYIVEYNLSSDQEKWLTAIHSVPRTETKATVQMESGVDYKFRVIAENKIGRSLPSESSEVCKAA